MDRRPGRDWQNALVTLQRLSSTDAFVVIDLPAADRADGIVRCARKVLVDSSRALARSRTYGWALLEQPVSGAAAGISAQGDDRGAAIAAFCDEIAPRVASGELALAAGKGIETAELDALPTPVPPDPGALVDGLLGCAESLTGSLAGVDVAIEHEGGATGLRAALEAAGATVVAEGADALTSPADLLLFGSRPGLIDHEMADRLVATQLLPTAEMSYTPRALAVATRRGARVLPDFLSTAGPLVARLGVDPRTRLAELAGQVLEHPEGAFMGACRRAEEFLSGWNSELPFGRPIG
jgi:hypothetical protein